MFYKYGIRVWSGGTGGGGFATPGDVSIINDTATAKQWQEAVAAIAEKRDHASEIQASVMGCRASAWDPRLEAIAIRNYGRYLNHINKYNGLRWGDDPVFAVWESTTTV